MKKIKKKTLAKVIEDRLFYLLVEEGEGDTPLTRNGMRVLAEDLVWIGTDWLAESLEPQ